MNCECGSSGPLICALRGAEQRAGDERRVPARQRVAVRCRKCVGLACCAVDASATSSIVSAARATVNVDRRRGGSAESAARSSGALATKRSFGRDARADPTCGGEFDAGAAGSTPALGGQLARRIARRGRDARVFHGRGSGEAGPSLRAATRTLGCSRDRAAG